MNKKKPRTDSIEVEAKTTKKAIEEALKKLDATEEEVTIEVLKEEQKGLFGMQGAEAAKVRVRIDRNPTPPDHK
ncbi:MAG: Jag N-terminal domain-containing protein [Candidatus Omnitrophota bacterium]